MRFARVVFGVSCSPFLLNATIEDFVRQYLETQSDLVEKLMQSTDVISGADDEEQAYEFYRGSKELLLDGSFNLQKFVTNTPSLQVRIDQREAIPQQENVVKHCFTRTALLDKTYVEFTMPIAIAAHLEEQRVLGVRWNVVTDRHMFDFREITMVARKLNPTERNVICMALRIVGRFYDPLGFLFSITIRFKVFVQELRKLNLCWDEELVGVLFE